MAAHSALFNIMDKVVCHTSAVMEGVECGWVMQCIPCRDDDGNVMPRQQLKTKAKAQETAWNTCANQTKLQKFWESDSLFAQLCAQKKLWCDHHRVHRLTTANSSNPTHSLLLLATYDPCQMQQQTLCHPFFLFMPQKPHDSSWFSPWSGTELLDGSPCHPPHTFTISLPHR